MPEAVNPGRRYDSPRRREQAAATRQAILEAAQQLFERNGYAATSVPAIAAEARVAVKTVYIAFGTKAALLHTLWGLRLAGDEAAIPVLERTWYREVADDESPEAKLRLAARQSRAVKTRSGSLLEVIRNAASVDPEIATLWREVQEKLHHVARALVAQLHDASTLRSNLDPATAADMLWTLNHPAVWQLLVRDRGWKPEQYEQWLEDVLRSQLLARDRAAPARQSVKALQGVDLSLVESAGVDSKDGSGRTRGGLIAMPQAASDLPPGLAAPARRALAAAGYSRLDQFTEVTEAEVRRLHGMGAKAIEQIRLALAAQGLTFSK